MNQVKHIKKLIKSKIKIKQYILFFSVLTKINKKKIRKKNVKRL